MADFEGASDHVQLLVDGVRRHSAIRSSASAAAAFAEEQGKVQREQEVLGQAAALVRDGNRSSIEDHSAPQRLPMGKPAKVEDGGSSGEAVAGAGSGNNAQKEGKDCAMPARVAFPRGKRQVKVSGKRSLSKLWTDFPLFKRLSGEGGAMSARVQPLVAVALRWGTSSMVPRRSFGHTSCHSLACEQSFTRMKLASASERETKTTKLA